MSKRIFQLIYDKYSVEPDQLGCICEKLRETFPDEFIIVLPDNMWLHEISLEEVKRIRDELSRFIEEAQNSNG